MKPLKNRYSLTLDEDVAEKIKEMAENDDRSFSQYINIILKEWIKAQESDRNEQITIEVSQMAVLFSCPDDCCYFQNINSKLRVALKQGIPGIR